MLKKNRITAKVAFSYFMFLGISYSIHTIILSSDQEHKEELG